MDLQYFPMDSQLCYIEIESCKYLSKNHSQYSQYLNINILSRSLLIKKVIFWHFRFMPK